MGTYTHQVLYMFLLHKMVHTQEYCIDSRPIHVCMHTVLVMYIFQHSDMLVHTQVFHISFQSTRMGTYTHQVLYMFLLHKMVHTQEYCIDSRPIHVCMHTVLVMYIFQHSDMLVHTQVFHISFQSTRMGTYTHQVLCVTSASSPSMQASTLSW
jgi:hypothetical protein